jgi:ubiquinone/menaquinone biosynthesis C-methylase UbiE
MALSTMQPARLPKAAVRPVYTAIAPTHDLLALLVEARARRLSLQWAAVADGEHVLEVAVGTGLTFRHLLRQNPSGWTEGIDLTPAMLQIARRRADRAPTTRYRLRVGDAYALPYPDNAFDLVMNSYMFDLLPRSDFGPVLREFRRVLRPGGRLVMANMTLGRRWYNQFWEWIVRLAPPLLGGCRGVRVAPSLAESGYVNVRRRYVSQRTFPSEVVLGRKPARAAR